MLPLNPPESSEPTRSNPTTPRGPEGASLRIWEPGNLGTPEPRNPGTLEPRKLGALEPGNRRTPNPGKFFANPRAGPRAYSGSSLQSQAISLRFSELSAAHSSSRATHHAARACTGACDRPSSASRTPA